MYLISILNTIGKEGLSTFGYEPIRVLSTERMTTTTGFQCIEEFDCSKVNLETNQGNQDGGKVSLVAR
jgi:hypothetical protein